ncbi:TPA: hypothetical protein N0F65_011910 [Lagenidium giganteum]|uniref:Pseudouridine synthase I TruA alpha/beta domain-containing protein n=1 Tax=Lagenidium giganteum TaxID=4803 RepID=A0AAV2YPV3_9STRA|nr:TPA: hypothetical protein N0F65_011910 [Lagenidium giganteum]
MVDFVATSGVPVVGYTGGWLVPAVEAVAAMAGKKRKTHWAVRRKNKQSRAEAGDQPKQQRDGDDSYHTRPDRRLDIPETIHPGSYAAQRAANATAGEPVAAPTAPKKRYALWIAFCGKKYSGMQMNEGVQTIEAELERALFEAGAIAESNYGFLKKIGWSRAARTDKGVHAAGQLLTAKLHVGDDVDAFIAKVNESLPEDIRVLHMVTTTKNFNAKMSCDQRTYEYLAPTFIFAPRTKAAAAAETAGSNGAKWPSNLDEEDIDDTVVLDPKTLDEQRQFRLSDTTFKKINETLARFVGTHNFHNFTSKLEPNSPKCKRFIMSFTADAPFVENNMEWIRLRVVGQSFLLHHIRKMIGTAVEIVAAVTDAETIARAVELDKMDLPKAPSVGLYLAQAHFEVYNQRMEDAIETTHPPLNLEQEDVRERVEQFKRDKIFKHIIEHEEKTRTYARWLRTLELLPFTYKGMPYAQWKEEKEREALLATRSEKRAATKAARAAHAAQAAEEEAEGAEDAVKDVEVAEVAEEEVHSD